jgi:uncharacterized protein
MDGPDHVTPSSDVAFTTSVKKQQSLRGSRRTYERVERAGGWSTVISPDLQAFIALQTSFFLATANAAGQPYIQHRGGPPGFLRVLDEKTLGFADFSGNRQYITLGNLIDNPKVHLFLMDYAHRKRVKIWGSARFVEGDSALNASLMPPDYNARAERAVLITVAAWDLNCRQHIPQFVNVADVAGLLATRDQRIVELEAEVLRLQLAVSSSVDPQLSLQTCAAPPSANNSMPVMKLESSEARNAATAASSSGVAMRPIGTNETR